MRANVETRQHRKRHLHHRGHLSQQRARYSVKRDITYTIGVLECSNDIVFIVRCIAHPGRAMFNDDSKVWPDNKILPDRSSPGAENLEIETVWRSKDSSPPPLAYVHEGVPFPYRENGVLESLLTHIKYFKQDIVWVHAYCRCMSVTLACATKSQCVLQSPQGC